MSKEKEEGWMIATAFAISVVDTLIAPLMFAKLWTWFAVPLGAPHVQYASAFGVMLVFYFLVSGKKLAPDDTSLAYAIRAVFGHVCVFAIAALVHGVMS